MANKAPNILADPRYLVFRERYYDNFRDYMLENCDVTPTWQQMEFVEACQRPGARVAVASGHGCFGKGTPILMFDGTVKPVEDVHEGDVLMGDDGTPRHVLRLCRGRECMYRFTFADGVEHIYNESHILCLVSTRSHGNQRYGEKIQVTVRQRMAWCEKKRNSYVAYRKRLKPDSSVIFPISIHSVTRLGEGEYYGFELDGNRRFLSGDLMVLHNTGKSFCLAWLLDWNMRVFPHSNAVLTATNIEQARSVVWKYLDGVIDCMDRMYPWMRGFFVKETRRYYARGYKDSWYVLPKTASKSAPENLAGQHNNNLLIVVDEASAVDDAIHGVLRGALTHRRNRYIMTSQPTRPSGHFADAMRKLSGQGGIYNAIVMNSEDSPIVSREFILEKLHEYNGHHSPEYQIKVLGHFPDNMAGYLIPRQRVEDCQYTKIEFDDDWGYVLLADVAEGLHRDSSVATLVKMSGRGDERKVECIECNEFLDMNEKSFARFIASKYHEYPNLTIAVDGDGAGRTVILDLQEMGIPVEAIHWGIPCHNPTAQARYANLRAYAHCKLREAIFDLRFRGPQKKNFVEQVSRLPYKIDERGRYAMTPKDKMRAEGIKSPDISDTCCFAFLVDYIPANTGCGRRESTYLELARKFMEAEEGSANV